IPLDSSRGEHGRGRALEARGRIRLGRREAPPPRPPGGGRRNGNGNGPGLSRSFSPSEPCRRACGLPWLPGRAPSRRTWRTRRPPRGSAWVGPHSLGARLGPKRRAEEEPTWGTRVETGVIYGSPRSCDPGPGGRNAETVDSKAGENRERNIDLEGRRDTCWKRGENRPAVRIVGHVPCRVSDARRT